MKTYPIAYATAIALGTAKQATALRVVRRDGVMLAVTSHDVDDVVNGVRYLSNPGLDATSIVTAANLAVGNLELTTLNDGQVFTTADIMSGVWRNARFLVFRYNHAGLADGIDILLAGTFGEVTLGLTKVTVELRSLLQYLQQGVGDLSTKNCRARLGDNRCKKDLTAFTFNSALTGVNSSQAFRDSVLLQPLAYYDEGQILFTSGVCNGLPAKIKSYAVDGTFTLALPMYVLPSAGDTYTAIAGCRKRLEEDCRDKFGNVLNFVGEPHRKGLNDLIKGPTADV